MGCLGLGTRDRKGGVVWVWVLVVRRGGMPDVWPDVRLES